MRWINPTLTLLSLTAIICACCIGSTPLGFERIIQAFIGSGETGDQIVIWEIRLPRALAAFLVGASLGISGAALQGLLRNPLAEPGVLGVSAFGSVAGIASISLGLVAVSPIVLPVAVIAGAMIATSLIAIAAIWTRSVVTLILIGVGASSFAGAVTSLLVNFAPNPFSLAEMMNWVLGSVANRSFYDIALVFPFLVIGLTFLLFASRGLSVLTLGEETAHGVGLNLLRQRILTVTGAGIATGASVALAGAIGFVGIVAPHLVRPLVGYDPSRTLIPSALLGGTMLVLADIAIRILPSTNELKLGVVVAMIGAPIFILVVVQRRELS